MRRGYSKVPARASLRYRPVCPDAPSLIETGASGTVIGRYWTMMIGKALTPGRRCKTNTVSPSPASGVGVCIAHGLYACFDFRRLCLFLVRLGIV